MPTLTPIFNGVLDVVPFTTSPFPGNGFLYFDTSPLLLIEVEFNVILPNSTKRKIPIGRGMRDQCQTIKYVRSDELVCVPDCLTNIELPLDLTVRAINTPQVAEITHVSEDYSLKRLERVLIVKSLVEIILPLIVGNVTTLLLPALSAGSERGFLELINNGSDVVYLGDDALTSATNHIYELPPGGKLSLPGYNGELYGFSGTTIQLDAIEGGL